MIIFIIYFKFICIKHASRNKLNINICLFFDLDFGNKLSLINDFEHGSAHKIIIP